jgi:hypothetical protein
LSLNDGDDEEPKSSLTRLYTLISASSESKPVSESSVAHVSEPPSCAPSPSRSLGLTSKSTTVSVSDAGSSSPILGLTE